MIYTVECSYADPTSEAEWTDFYSFEKLPALISVKGFHTSQRFRSLSMGCPVYLAIHTIDGLAVLAGEEYRQMGGGNFARWQQHITDWQRNVYATVDPTPAVHEDELLVVSANGPQALIKMGLTPMAMQAVALDQFPQRRWLAKQARQGAPHVTTLPDGVHLYAPMTGQLTSVRTAAVEPEV